ncbi:M1 family metallopeptidase [Rubrivirga sp. S365]|uniref:M1 family metallopeptidase n=1 Tax=Rubrivirga litoralis TaxID=3075598 RepID=A0ABU3BTC5_9BACT|nr:MULTISPECIES: M1 family metallopeptidase [unclassified Rubrivirga]MDT0632544.1 M1 family metallopeptidase [Rubrivirga sp. F394]MDT7856770.1 M1 family metallopeptidase [Rubrivirga sp. S365]
MPLRLTVLAALALGAALPAAAQRVLPYPVTPPPQFERAVANGTRSPTGAPGPNYWQNGADYDIDARLDEATQTLVATGTITYHNNSPDALPYLVLKLRQNVHAPGVPRNRPVAVTGGLALSRLAVGGADLRDVTVAETPGSYSGSVEPGTYAVNGTVLTLGLPAPLAPGDSVALDVAWSYPVPPATGTYRQGTDGEVTYIGYWYPQVAVYDDVMGWHTDPYLGNGEHYMDFGRYAVDFDVPAGWLAWGTGRLANADEVLTEQTRGRLAEALTSDDVVHVITEDERGRATQPGTDGRLVWRFEADRVRDVALATSDAYVWDATHADVDQDGDGDDEAVLINALYRPAGERPMEAPWERSAEFSRFSIEHLSDLIFPYPWPHMTAVEGVITGGMEYPMMTLIGGDRSAPSLFGVTYHEIGHMWFPMIVGTNEKAYTWMDEGLTSFDTNEGVAAFFDGSSEARPAIDAWDRARQSHYALAGTGEAVAPMRHNDLFPIGGGTREVDAVQGGARVVASYSTPAVLLHALRGLYGEPAFYDAYREYARRWEYKHAYPYDFFNTVENRLGEDLDWAWTPTLFDTWTVDQAVASVQSEGGAVVVTVEDQGRAPMPAPVRVTYADGRVEDQTVPVETWLSGATTAALRFAPGEVARVEIDPGQFLPDVDRTDNVYPAEPADL